MGRVLGGDDDWSTEDRMSLEFYWPDFFTENCCQRPYFTTSPAVDGKEPA